MSAAVTPDHAPDPTVMLSRVRTPEAEFATAQARGIIAVAHDRGIKAHAVVVTVYGKGLTLIAQGTSIKVPT